MVDGLRELKKPLFGELGMGERGDVFFYYYTTRWRHETIGLWPSIIPTLRVTRRRDGKLAFFEIFRVPTLCRDRMGGGWGQDLKKMLYMHHRSSVVAVPWTQGSSTPLHNSG